MAAFLYYVICATVVCHMGLVAFVVVCLCYRLANNKKRVTVLVLGDVGRSPRMQYHAKSLAQNGFEVEVVGYPGSKPINDLLQHEKVSFYYLSPPLTKIKGLPTIIWYVLKTFLLMLQLAYVLFFKVRAAPHVLIQNPPAIPTLFISWMVCCVKGSSMIVDWHNYTHTILALNAKSKQHPLVRFAKWYEGVFGQFASKNICVTMAMKNDLAAQWNISADVLYDRPMSFFKSLDVEEKHLTLLRLSEEFSELKCWKGSDVADFSKSTLLTSEDSDGHILYKERRPALIVSSTSWTEDEDFSIFLEALEDYNQLAASRKDLPNVVCAITGKGPLKAFYQERIQQLDMKHVKIFTPWLEPDDYPKMLGCADLGVCLHTSSSGLDLPMKVVDMFGCGLPVCAVGFQCLDELVVHGVNGLVFTSSNELCAHLLVLLSDFPKRQPLLSKFRANLVDYQNSRWDTNWQRVALPLFQSSLETRK